MFQSLLSTLKINSQDTLDIQFTLTNLNKLNSEELTRLYAQTPFTPLKNNRFEEFFKKPENQHHLFYFLSTILIEEPKHWQGLLTSLSNENLLKLIELLLDRRMKSPAYTGSLNQVLVFFCDRLNSETALHQWNLQPYSHELVMALLQNPDCLLSLSQFQSSLFWHSYESLKPRIDAVFNFEAIDEGRLKQAAFICLEHFKGQPSQLHTLFTNLHHSKKNRNAMGERHLAIVQETIWTALNSKEPYNEKKFLSLFSSSNEALKKFIVPSKNEFSTYQQAIWLAKEKEELTLDYPMIQLINILEYSIDSQTINNWSKTSTWLKKQDLETQCQFLKKLIQKNAHALFNQRSYELIKQTLLDETPTPTYNEQEFAWLLQQSNKEEQKIWLNRAMSQYAANQLNFGLFFFSLPESSDLLREVTSHSFFSQTKALASICVQAFDEHHNAPIVSHSFHLNYVLPSLKNKNRLWMNSFLNELVSLAPSMTRPLALAPLITNLIVDSTPSEAQDNEPHDKEMLSNYLTLMNLFLQKPEENGDKIDLETLMSNALNVFIQQEKHWAEFIFCTPAFNELCISLATQAPNKKIAKDNLSIFLSNPYITQLDTKTKINPDVQRSIYTFLHSSISTISLEQFQKLLECLSHENQMTLARLVFTQAIDLTLNQSILKRLSTTLTLNDLLTLFNKTRSYYLFKEITTHSEAINQLSNEEWTNLFTQRSTSELIELLNNEQLSLDIRANYLRGFFKAYQTKPQLLEQWALDDTQLLTLANFVFDKTDQLLLQKIISTKNYTLALCLDTLSFHQLNRNSYLHKKIKEAILDNKMNHSEQTLTQFYRSEYSYQAGDKDNEERLQELVKLISHISIPVLAQIINSYVPAYTVGDTETLFFLIALENCLKELTLKEQANPSLSLKLLNQLNDESIRFIFNNILSNPDYYNFLLQAILNSKHSDLLRYLIQGKLNYLITESEQNEAFIELNTLSKEQISRLSHQQLSTLMLLHYAHYCVKPREEFLLFLKSATDPKEHANKKIFCALASLYQDLTCLKETVPGTFNSFFFSWLINYAKTYFNDSLMNDWEQKSEHKDPLVLFHWLRWKTMFSAQVYNNKEILPKALIRWLGQHTKEQLDQAAYLKEFFDYAVNNNYLPALFVYANKHSTLLNDEQKRWLSEQSLIYVENDANLLASIIELNPSSSLLLLLEKITTHQFAVLKKAVEQENYWDNLLAQTEGKKSLLRVLRRLNFSASEFIELINGATHQQIKTQLILFFLTQTHYLNSLAGPSGIDVLSNMEQHQPSRLNGLAQQLNIESLNKEQIQQLPPETALSILCCVPHFSSLNLDQVRLLWAQIPQPELLNYWLNQYAAMPNGFYMLAHFMTLAEPDCLKILDKVSGDKKEWFIWTLLEHLELFDKNNKFLQNNLTEAHLVQGIKKYLNGHTHPHYIHFIKQAVPILLNKNHVFSLDATQFLIRLHGDPQFTELTQTTAYLINHHLKMRGESSSLEFFYEGNHPSINAMAQLIPVKPKLPENEKPNNLFTQFLNTLQLNNAGLPHHDHPIINELANSKTLHISAFDYFLIHYKGNPTKLSNALEHYISYYAQQKKESHKNLYVISTLLTRQELEPEIRTLIYKNLLKYPQLFDRHIGYCLFLFNPQKTLQYFGLRGTKEAYQIVVDLCNLALTRLDPKVHEKNIHIAKTALFEAETELSFAEEQGFFSRLFRRFIRCWYYGWTGFFTPKAPVYVCPIGQATAPQQVKAEKSVPPFNSCHPIQELAPLLELLEQETNLVQLNALLYALNDWELKKQKPDEIKTRQALHQLFHKILSASANDPKLSDWLKEHQAALILNRLHLLENFLASNQLIEAHVLLNESNEDSPYLHYLTKELNHSLPTVSSLPLAPKEENQVQPEDSILNTASSLAQSATQSAWEWVMAFSIFSPPPKEKEPQVPKSLTLTST